MKFITTINRPFVSEDLFSGSIAGHHTYKAVKRNVEGKAIRTDFITAIAGVSVKFVLSTLDEEEGDTCLCAEVSFEVDGDYDKKDRGIKVRATRWLLGVWEQAQEGYGEFYCDPHDADGHLSYRRNLFAKFGFVEDHGMLVLK